MSSSYPGFLRLIEQSQQEAAGMYWSSLGYDIGNYNESISHD